MDTEKYTEKHMKGDDEQAAEEPARRSHSRSLFGPILLIAIGVYLLLDNLNLLPAVDWEALFSFWPLILIFAGFNILVRQVPRPWGTFLSGFVALMLVAALALILFLPAWGIGDLSLTGVNAALYSEQVVVPLWEAQRARVELEFNEFGGRIYGLEDSPNLLVADVMHRGSLVSESRAAGETHIVVLNSGEGWDLLNWLSPVEGDPWNIGLNRNVPLDLRVNLSSGAAQLDLAELRLEELDVQASSGATTLLLPEGNYAVTYDVSAGPAEIVLPDRGDVTLEVDGGSGSVSIDLPSSMALRVLVTESGSGSFQPGRRLLQSEPDGSGKVWETESYAQAAERVVLTLELGSGAVRIGEQ